MNKKFRISSKKLALAVSVSVVSVLVITVCVLTAALSTRDKGDKNPMPLPETGTTTEKPPVGGETTLPDATLPNSGKPNGGTNSGDNGTNGDKPSDGQETVVPPVDTTPKWTQPVAGYVFKGHSSDALVYSLTLGDWRIHRGIDISVPVGENVKACLDGKVEAFGYDPMMGYFVTLSHENGYVSHYKNLSSEFPSAVSVGASVKSGDIIGAVGESAISEFSDESHLHFELEVGGKQSDPMKYLSYELSPSEIETE